VAFIILHAMAFVTGGLGGLGMLAANELSQSGKKQVVTTSRTGFAAAMRPELMQIMSSMQQHSVHYSVKCDGSDGIAQMDTMKAFCTSKPTAEQSQVFIADIIENLKGKIGSIPKHLIAPTITTMEKSKVELAMMLEEIKAKESSSKKVSEEEVKELRDRESQVSELIGKLKEKLGGKTGGSDVSKTARQLASEVTDLAAHASTMLSEEEAAEVNEFLTGIPAKTVLPPEYLGIETVVHAAGVLADGLIMTSTNNLGSNMSKVFGAKAHGAWHLFHGMNAMG